MAKTMPGVESFDVHDDRHWTANVKIPLGLGGLKMKVDMEKVEEREPEFAKLAIKGNGVGAMMNMETSFTLADADEGGTSMAWSAEVKLLGPVGFDGPARPAADREPAGAARARRARQAGARGHGRSDSARTAPRESARPRRSVEAHPEGPTTSTED